MTRRLLLPALLTALLACGAEDPPAVDEWLDLAPILALLPDDPILDTWPNPAYERLVALREEGPARGDHKAFGAAIRDLELVQTHLRKLATDVDYRDRVLWRSWVRLHPLWRKLDPDEVHRPPWIVFYEVPSEERRAAARRNAELAAEALQAQYEAFRRHFGEPLGLPDLRLRKRPEERVLKAFLFARRESFGESCLGRDWRSVDADYLREGRWTLSVAGRGLNQNHLLYAGACQLYDRYRSIRGGGRPGKRLYCFEEGFLLMLSRAERRKDGSFEFLVPAEDRLRRWKEFRDGQYAEWTLFDLLGVRNLIYARRKGMEIAGLAAGHMSELFFTESWSFCHFLWFHRDGRYRQRFLDRLGCELAGRTEIPDWQGMEPEWRSYVAALWKELGIK